MKKILFLFITLSSISCNLSNNKTSDDYISEGLSKVNQADYKGAIADYDTAIMLNANNKRAYYHRGNAKGYLSDFKSAICDYDTALILDSNDVNNYLVYNARGDTKNNLAFLKSSWLDSSSYKNMSEKEITASFMAAIADSLDSKDYYLAAIADYTKAIELNSDNADSYFSRGFSKEGLQDYRGAIADFSKAIEINPKYTQAYYSKGISRIAIGQKDSGCLDLSKAGELGSEKAYEVIKKNCN